MDSSNVVYVTAEGLQLMEEELRELKTTRREEIAMRLEAAIKQGDLKENADYHDAKEEQGLLEARVKFLEDALRRVEVIQNHGPSDVVRVGSTVTVVEAGTDDEEVYMIVGAQEADPANGRISNESPIGRALLGARVGHTVAAAIPSGEINFEVRQIG